MFHLHPQLHMLMKTISFTPFVSGFRCSLGPIRLNTRQVLQYPIFITETELTFLILESDLIYTWANCFQVIYFTYNILVPNLALSIIIFFHSRSRDQVGSNQIRSISRHTQANVGLLKRIIILHVGSYFHARFVAYTSFVKLIFIDSSSLSLITLQNFLIHIHANLSFNHCRLWISITG